MRASSAIACALALACASEPLDEHAGSAAAAGQAGEAGAADAADAAGAAGEGGALEPPGASGAGGAPALGGCPAALEPAAVGELAEPEISEASGLAASRRHPGVLYTHNDSGAAARGYALREDGSLVATLELTGALAQDWEDMGIGPGPDADASYLYIADIGDNDVARNGVVVHRALEPELDVAASDQSVDLDFVSLYFEYPDGAHDAETLLVDPETADLYIVSKALAGSDVYVARAPHSTTEITTLEHVASLSLPPLALATSGDIAADGGLILIRTYDGVFGWPRAAGESVGEALSGERCELPAPVETQGEAIAVARDAAGYYTIGEGLGATVFRVDFE